jgi:hypothetical protein
MPCQHRSLRRAAGGWAGGPAGAGRGGPCDAGRVDLPLTARPGRPLGRVRCGRPRPLPGPQDRCRAKPVSVPPPARRRRAAGWRARCGESRTPGSASGLRKRTGGNAGTAPQADSTSASRRTWIQAQSVRDERAQYATGEQTSCQAQVPCLWSALRQRPDVLSITDTLNQMRPGRAVTMPERSAVTYWAE